jgi:outer membrane protein TolC
LRVERQRFEQGMTRLMDLVEREENFNTAIIRWVDAQIQYETAKVSLQLADGSLLDTFNIQFDLEI